MIPSEGADEGMVRNMLEVYLAEKDRLNKTPQKLTCLKRTEGKGCISVSLFQIDRGLLGGIVFIMNREPDPIDESYIKVIWIKTLKSFSRLLKDTPSP